MFDQELAREVLEQIHHSIRIIQQRFEPVATASDFTDSPYGMEKLDAICMQLIAIGEGLKNLDKITRGRLLENYPDIEWKKAMGLRDIIAHHYFDVNAEAIYTVCCKHIPILGQTVLKIMSDLER